MKTGPEFLAVLEQERLGCLAIQAGHALVAADLPRHHMDPFDRMLVAQAITEGLCLVTRDRRLRDYEVSTLKG